jgi:putative transposase
MARYIWRRLTEEQREDLLAWRKKNEKPWHSPPHQPNFGHLNFFISAACYQHASFIGACLDRMQKFSADLLNTLHPYTRRTIAWCVLPNHYHVLVETENVLRVIYDLGRMHGRTSRAWNIEDKTPGRKVFHRASDRYMRSERHFFATINYIHNNPVHHRYVRLWTEWPWSSASEQLAQIGRAEAKRLWTQYPVRGYGKGWDDAAL